MVVTKQYPLLLQFFALFQIHLIILFVLAE